MPQWPSFLQQPANFIPNSPLLGQVPALDLSRIAHFPQMQGQLPSWNIAAEQTGEGMPSVASNPGTLVSDMSGIEVPMGENANALPTADQFAQILTGLADEQKIVSFYAQDVTIRNAEWMERMANETLMKPTHVTSALTIPTPVGNAIVTLSTTQTTPTTSTTRCALSMTEELIRTFKQVAQQNAELHQQLSKLFGMAVRPLLGVHRTAAQKTLGSSSSALVPIPSSASALRSGPAMTSSSGSAKGPHASSARNRPLTNRPIPHATQPSRIGTSTENSSAAYATPNETMEQFGIFDVDQDVLGEAQRSDTPKPLVMKIKTGQGSVSSVSSLPSPMPGTGVKDMAKMKELMEQEKEEARRAKAERKKPAKAEKRKAATPSSSSSSSCSFTTSSSEEQQPAEKIKATKKGKKATRKAPAKVPSKTQSAGKPRGKRSLDDVAQTSMPPPATGTVKWGRRSVLEASTSASKTSVGANVSIKKPTPEEAQEQELSSSSEADTRPAKKENVNMDQMEELNAAATHE